MSLFGELDVSKVVYLTSPESGGNVKQTEEMRELLIKENYDVFTAADLSDYLEFHFGDCHVSFYHFSG